MEGPFSDPTRLKAYPPHVVDAVFAPFYFRTGTLGDCGEASIAIS